MDHPQRNISASISSVTSGLDKLKKANASYCLAIRFEGHTQIYGTGRAKLIKEKFKQQVEDALVDDALDLYVAAAMHVDATRKAFELKNGEGVKRLPYPLSLMNRKEKMAQISGREAVKMCVTQK